MGEEKKAPTTDQRVAGLEAQLKQAQADIHWMRSRGGFTDAKTLSGRCARIEERVEKLEFDGVMHKDVTAHFADFAAKHLSERHGLNLDRDNVPDVIYVRKIRRRLREWAEAVGLMNKRRDVSGARQDENRLRPSVANS